MVSSDDTIESWCCLSTPRPEQDQAPKDREGAIDDFDVPSEAV